MRQAWSLLGRASRRRMTLECSVLPCVTDAFKLHSNAGQIVRALINPANTALCGARSPAFPRGGPVPKPPPDDTLKSSFRGWGGMDAGADMLYPAQAVDGVVSLLGGAELRAMLQAFPCHGRTDDAGQPLRCPVGSSVITEGRCGELEFDLVAHAVPPFWSDGSWEQALRSCYASSLQGLIGRTCSLASSPAQELWIASPLLGSGARGAPSAEAAQAAVSELVTWLVEAEPSHGDDALPSMRFRFVVLPGDGQAAFRTVCGAIADAVDEHSDALDVLADEARSTC